jgi:putative hydrolase of the HAD superfamily
LDAFDTLIRIDPSRLFQHQAGDRTIHTTAPEVHKFYEDVVGKIDFQSFVEGFLKSGREANRRRKADFREIPSADRFSIMLDMLDCEHEPSQDLPARLAQAHMGHLAPAMDIPDSHKRALDWSLDQGYRLAMISNFDYAPTVHQCLENHNVHDMFDVIVVSDETGWRKPHPAIFEHTLQKLDVVAAECLFVGDRLDLDVDGAAGVGMDVVWIDTGVQEWTPEYARPQYTVGAFPEVVQILGGE